MDNLLPELTELIGRDEAIQFLEAWISDEAEQYANEMTALWQEE